MSILLGARGERWPLTSAVDALRDSARRAGAPGLIWIAGICYPGLNLSVDIVSALLGMIEEATDIDIPGATESGALVFLFGPFPICTESMLPVLGYTLLLMPLYVLLYRLVVGLAKVSDPGRWVSQEDRRATGSGAAPGKEESGRPLGLRSAWREGRGLGASACGMWMVLFALLIGVTLFLLGPLVAVVNLLDLRTLNTVVIGLILPVLAMILGYGAVLQALNQLGLHSLAHNRRGVASALTHAWRLVRGSPWGAARAMILDFVLFLVVLAAALGVERLVGTDSLWRKIVTGVLVLACYGFAGVTRAGFWARAYRAMGGLSAEDQVPGLHR